MSGVTHFFVMILSLVCVGCTSHTSPRSLWRSVPQGDYVVDQRNPADVCAELQRRDRRLRGCTLVKSKTSIDGAECSDGMSVAGCFACRFVCE